MTLVQKEPKYIKIWSTDAKKVYLGSNQVRPRPVNFATQWPCPDGFHIPLSSELDGMRGIMSSLWLGGGANYYTYLHIPFAWGRNGTNASTFSQGSAWWLWSCTPNDSQLGKANLLYIDTGSGGYITNAIKANGYSIRWFKNKFVVPTSSWTVLYWTLWGAWIFRNQTDWIISITTNWSTGYTIMDKNLWATTVYNSWDTRTEANCGKYYQWGNNYWFAWTWSVTTSSSTVNASSYWPWNYYSSSTFITVNGSWDNSYSKNLRWWVTGNVPV